MYITSDGKTRIKIELSDDTLDIVFIFNSYSGSAVLNIDWGDGNNDSVSATLGENKKSHSYNKSGEYTITLSTPYAANVFTISSCIDITNVVKEIQVGDRIMLGQGFCLYLVNLKAVSLPNIFTSTVLYFLQYAMSIKTVVIPDGVTSIFTGFMLSTQPTHVIFPKSFAPTSFGMDGKCLLRRIYVPSSVTSIPNYGFRNCANLHELVIPSGVTSIGNDAFNSCHSIRYIKFRSSTPATVGNSTAFNGVPTDCIIYVPEGSQEDYEGETNYPDPDVYSYVEY